MLKDVRKIARSGDEYTPASPKDLASKIFYTAYMGSTNSSAETRARAKTLAAEIGATHTDLDIDRGTDAIMAIFKTATGKTPMFTSSGGTPAEDVALQNIQARMRMVLAYVSAAWPPHALPRLRCSHTAFLPLSMWACYYDTWCFSLLLSAFPLYTPAPQGSVRAAVHLGQRSPRSAASAGLG